MAEIRFPSKAKRDAATSMTLLNAFLLLPSALRTLRGIRAFHARLFVHVALLETRRPVNWCCRGRHWRRRWRWLSTAFLNAFLLLPSALRTLRGIRAFHARLFVHVALLLARNCNNRVTQRK
jgi:hypothetical protein